MKDPNDRVADASGHTQGPMLFLEYQFLHSDVFSIYLASNTAHHPLPWNCLCTVRRSLVTHVYAIHGACDVTCSARKLYRLFRRSVWWVLLARCLGWVAPSRRLYVHSSYFCVCFILLPSMPKRAVSVPFWRGIGHPPSFWVSYHRMTFVIRQRLS